MMVPGVRSRSRHSTDSDANPRKRVSKACDRCRLKKSKCDGTNPCSPCQQDNTICTFSETKKCYSKVYPKGYVEMLEHQQSQLVAGLQELYRKLQAGECWPGSPLENADGGYPLTHDILERLDLLQSSQESSTKQEGFRNDLSRLQDAPFDNDASLMRRRDSVGSDSGSGLSHSPPSHDTPSLPPLSYIEPLLRNQAPLTPSGGSPFLRSSQLAMPIETRVRHQPIASSLTPQQLMQYAKDMDMEMPPCSNPSISSNYVRLTMSPVQLADSRDDFDAFINF